MRYSKEDPVRAPQLFGPDAGNSERCKPPHVRRRRKSTDAGTSCPMGKYTLTVMVVLSDERLEPSGLVGGTGLGALDFDDEVLAEVSEAPLELGGVGGPRGPVQDR